MFIKALNVILNGKMPKTIPFKVRNKTVKNIQMQYHSKYQEQTENAIQRKSYVQLRLFKLESQLFN